MAAPVLTPTQIAQLQKERAKQVEFRDAMNASVAQKEARVEELEVADSAFKQLFDWYNNSIIAKYDAERRALNGKYIAAPITEADVIGPATVDGSVRTTPVNPVTDIIRVPEFDGGPLVDDSNNEAQEIANQAALETALVSGYSGSGFNTATALSDSALTPASTSLKIVDPTNTINVPNGATFIVKDFTGLAVVKVTGTITPAPMTPPYSATYSIELVVPPSPSVGSGATLVFFSGFNNTERTNKTASDSELQPLMDYFVEELEDIIARRLSRMDFQVVAIATNDDPDGASEFVNALENIEVSTNFLENYLTTTDISNTGLGTLATERGVRSGEITSRVAEIVSAYTGRTTNYFEARYSVANNRANTARGSLRLQYATDASLSQILAFAAGAQDSIDAIDSLLP